MNKNILIAAVVVLVLLIAGGGFLMMNKSKTSSQDAMTSEKKESNVFSSIQDALSRSMSLECNYTTPNGIKSVAYIKNGMVRSESTGSTPQESGNSIIKDKKIYFWNAQGGFVMDVPEISVTPVDGQDSMTGAQSTLDALEQYKSYCKEASVPDSKFQLPAGIEFRDMSQMMPSGAMPSGAMPKTPTGMSQQDVEELMKRYQNPSQ